MLSAISQYRTPRHRHMHGCHQRYKDVRVRVCMTLSMCTKTTKMAAVASKSGSAFYPFGYKTETGMM